MELDPRMRKSDFDITQVDFEWVEVTKDPRKLKKALKALRDEGGYDMLAKAVEEKLH
jgi:glutaredoxin-related protein